MIQRIQSIYLLVAAVLAGATVALPEPVQAASEGPNAWLPYVAWGLAGLTALVALISIFLYKNRKRQRGIVLGAQFLALGLLLVGFMVLFLTGQLQTLLGPPVNIQGILLLAWPLLAYLFLYLARRAIDKDIKLVRSMDRLRD